MTLIIKNNAYKKKNGLIKILSNNYFIRQLEHIFTIYRLMIIMTCEKYK